MTLFTVVNKAGFQAGFNAGNDTFVDIAFTRFAAGRLNVDVDQFLAVDDGYPQLLGVGGVE